MAAKKLTQKRSRETERQILGTATKLFAGRGYSQVTMQDIADGAGIAKATLYYHTASKEDLAMLVVDAHLDEFVRAASEAAMADLSAAERLEQTIALLIDWITAGQEIVEFMLPHGGKPPSKFMRRLKTFRAHYLELLEVIVRDGLASGEFQTTADPAVAVRALLGMIVHFHVLSMRFDEPYKLADVRQQIIELSLHGLGARGDAS